MAVDLRCLNDCNDASITCEAICAKLAKEGGWHKEPDAPGVLIQHDLVGAEFGIAYGGGIQRIGRLWKPICGTIHGFDTFAGHPKQLGRPGAAETVCMDGHYVSFGTDTLSYQYQRDVLDAEGLDNVVLHPGLIDERSLDDIDGLDYCLLDLDFESAMRLAWGLVRPRMRWNGYLCLHDVAPRGHLPGLWQLYQEILHCGEYELVSECSHEHLATMRRA